MGGGTFFHKTGWTPAQSAAATRAQFAAILARALPAEALTAQNSVPIDSVPDVPASAAGGIYTLYRAGILTGSDGKGTFNPNSTISRAEVAAIVTRMADKSLRKSITLTAPITLSSLQGAWYCVRYNTDGSIATESELVIQGSSFTYARRSYIDSAYLYFTAYCLYEGTITNVLTDYTDGNGTVYPLALDWEGTHIENVKDGVFDTRSVKSGEKIIKFKEADPGAGTLYCSHDMSGEMKKVSSPTITEEIKEALPANPATTSAYDYIVDYAKRKGTVENYGDYTGEYRVLLDPSRKIGKNTSWHCCLYYNPDNGDLTLAGSFHYSVTTYSDSAATTVTLKIPRNGKDWNGTFASRSYILGSTTTAAAEIKIDPADFTAVKPITFASYDGPSDDRTDHETTARQSTTIFLHSLDQDILDPNGYTLKDLGFTRFV